MTGSQLCKESVDIRLSIVIAAYNAQDDILECLESVSLRDEDCLCVEVVVVDDASTDETVQLIQQHIAKTDHCVRLIRQPTNRGIGVSRRRGCAEAHGQYVWFVDSDDLVNRETIHRVLAAVERCGDNGMLIIDTILQLTEEGTGQGSVALYHSFPDQSEVRGDVVRQVDVDMWRRSYFAGADVSQMWNKVFPRSVARDGLVELRYSEDFSSVLRMMPDINRVYEVSGEYTYRYRVQSLSHRRRSLEDVNLASLDRIMDIWQEIERTRPAFAAAWRPLFRMNHTRRIIHREIAVLKATGSREEKARAISGLARLYSFRSLTRLLVHGWRSRRDVCVGWAAKVSAEGLVTVVEARKRVQR